MRKKNQNSNVRGAVLVTGSIVLDTLFDLTSSIKEQIVLTKGKLGKQNLMFNAREKQVYFGGTAGNVAYGLRLLGEEALLASIAGKDFGEYAKHLAHSGVSNRLYIDEVGYTATFYGMTDSEMEQIGIFQGNSYYNHVNVLPLARMLKQKDWAAIKVAIFSAGTAKSISRGAKECRENTAPDALIIVDPGQMLMIDFPKADLEKAIRVADMLILNETEAHFLKTKFGISLEQLWKWGLKYYIVTAGERGSILHTKSGSTSVRAFKVKNVVDPTGAGDAYRAGLVSGILSGLALPKAMELGAKLGAKCVSVKGAQTYLIQ